MYINGRDKGHSERWNWIRYQIGGKMFAAVCMDENNECNIQERVNRLKKGWKKMAFDFKKEYKEFYMPKNKPEIIKIPPMNYVAVRGKGNPRPDYASRFIWFGTLNISFDGRLPEGAGLWEWYKWTAFTPWDLYGGINKSKKLLCIWGWYYIFNESRYAK